MGKFSEQDIQMALDLTGEGVAVVDICERIGCSRATYYNWKNEGELTGGTPWDEYLKDKKTFEKASTENESLTIEVERSDKFWEDQVPKLRKAIQDSVDSLASGERPLDPSELEKMISLVRKLENRGKELAMLQEQFMRKVFFAVREIVDDKYKFEAIKERIKEIRLDQLNDFSEGEAGAILESIE